MASSGKPESLHNLVHGMGKARNQILYMPTALLAVCDLAEQGRIRDGRFRTRDYKTAFKRLMLEVSPPHENRWFQPLFHCKKHRLWLPMLGKNEIEFNKNQVSHLTETRADAYADSARLHPTLSDALASPAGRSEVKELVYRLLEKDDDPLCSRLAEVHEHLDPMATDSELLRDLESYEHRREEREAFEALRPGEDLRLWRPAERAIRQGQPAFRRAVLDAYERRCCVSDADAPDALDAAHIVPFRGEHSNDVTNGLLLRGDLHTLFDLGRILVQIKKKQPVIKVASELKRTVYCKLDGQPLRLPTRPELRPNLEALKWHHDKNSG